MLPALIIAAVGALCVWWVFRRCAKTTAELQHVRRALASVREQQQRQLAEDSTQQQALFDSMTRVSSCSTPRAKSGW